MNILALDTSTETCSVALWTHEVLYTECVLAPKAHAQLILPQVKRLLSEANIALTQLNLITFGQGPGSFTGLRIAASITQGLSYAHNIPVLPISSLRALAQGAFRKQGYSKVYAVMDARMQEVYWGGFELRDGIMMCMREEQLNTPESIEVPEEKGWHMAGAWGQCDFAILTKRLGCVLEKESSDLVPEAQDLVPLARYEYGLGHVFSYEQAVPRYLRNTIVKDNT